MKDKLIEFVKDYKKQLIISGVCLLVMIIGINICKGIMSDKVKEFNDIETEIQVNSNEINKYRDKDTTLGADTSDKYNLIYSGNVYNLASWQSDDNIFWDYIKDAFNFKSADEYNSNRIKYAKSDMTFYALFLEPFKESEETDLDYAKEHWTLTTGQSAFESHIIGMHDNSYDYIAFITAGNGESAGKNTMNISKKRVAFTYTINHDTNEIENFKFLPIDD